MRSISRTRSQRVYELLYPQGIPKRNVQGKQAPRLDSMKSVCNLVIFFALESDLENDTKDFFERAVTLGLKWSLESALLQPVAEWSVELLLKYATEKSARAIVCLGLTDPVVIDAIRVRCGELETRLPSFMTVSLLGAMNSATQKRTFWETLKQLQGKE